jgi:acetylornithine deacetylase/succinyl-diaminopimelate desuccinylase-like protein
MTTQHTPGPWTTDGAARTGDLDVISPAGRITLIDCEFSDESEDVLTANARLISAAPDLLAAIEGLLNALPSATTHPAIKAARAAIAKATGEAA